MRTTTAHCIVLVSTILAVLSPAVLLSQSAESSPGINRPVTREEIDRLRRTIYDETQSNFEGIFVYHSESGDLNNRLNFYRLGARGNFKLDSGALLYLGGTWTPYSTLNDSFAASGANATFGLKTNLAESVVSQFEAGATRFSTGGSTINALASFDFSFTNASLNFTASRTNVEESLLSAAGIRPVTGPFAGRTVGQVMDNRAVVSGTYQLREKLDVFGNGGTGYRKGVEVDSNPFWLGGGGVGYNVISAPAEESISLLRASYEANYIGYRDNRLGFGGSPASVGGYFSPETFFNHVIRGELRGAAGGSLEYQVSGFVGSQYITGSSRRQAAGFSGMVSVRISDRYSLPVTFARDNFGPFTQESVFARLVVRF